MAIPNADDSSTGDAGAFKTTHWSVVMTAARQSSPGAEVAVASLCQTYWYPLYAFSRRRGHSHHEAEDLTQEFFARLLDKNYLKAITVEGGKFRSYLLTLLKHFLANEWNRERAQKRGGGKTLFPSTTRLRRRATRVSRPPIRLRKPSSSAAGR